MLFVFSTGANGRLAWQWWSGGRRERLRLVLGALGPESPLVPSTMFEQAFVLLDRSVKNFLMSLWRLRTSLLGRLSMKGGQFHSQPVPLSFHLLARRQLILPCSLDVVCKSTSPMVRSDGCVNSRICTKRNGAAGAKRSSQSKVAKGRPPFYVVWSGRSRGVFTMWRECLSSIFRFPGAQFKSFYSLEQAQDAYIRGS